MLAGLVGVLVVLVMMGLVASILGALARLVLRGMALMLLFGGLMWLAMNPPSAGMMMTLRWAVTAWVVWLLWKLGRRLRRRFSHLRSGYPA